jgi:hypothetical protein
MQPSEDDLRGLFNGSFANLLHGSWAEWRKGYVQQLQGVAQADSEAWAIPAFQQRLWDDASVSSIGPGQSVTLVEAYTGSCPPAWCNWGLRWSP